MDMEYILVSILSIYIPSKRLIFKQMPFILSQHRVLYSNLLKIYNRYFTFSVQNLDHTLC